MGSVIVATLLCSASALTTPLPARLQSSKSSSLPSLITSKPPLFAAAATHRAPPPTLVSPPVLALRGGLAFAAPATIDGAFNMIFGVLSLMVATLVVSTREKRDTTAPAVPKAVRGLQWRFLLVFWLFKMADWLQGPYFYEVYASKIINGVAVSSAGVARLFLTGFGSTALFGAVVGGLVDGLGRKKGSLAFALMYSLSALSTKCGTLGWLFAGRVAGGIGTSLLFSAPEAWLVSEHQKVREESGRESTAHTAHAHLGAHSHTAVLCFSLSLSWQNKFEDKYLGQTFGLAYLGDSIVAILAGQLAGLVAAGSGPTAPFELSVLFLIAGAVLVTFAWKENFGGSGGAVAAAADDGVEAVKEEPPSEGGGAIVKEAAKVRVQQQASSSKASSQGKRRPLTTSPLPFPYRRCSTTRRSYWLVRCRCACFACYAASLVDCCTHLLTP